MLENIRFFAEVRGLPASEWQPRCLEILEFVGLVDFKDRRAGQLSGGMKQKLGLAPRWSARPRVLLLDEPTTGVDPVTRQDFWQLIIRLAASDGPGGVCVLISTPYMDEAERCQRIGFMRHGKIITEGSPGELRARLNDRILELRGAPLPLLRDIAAQDPGGGRCAYLRRPPAPAAQTPSCARSYRAAASGSPARRRSIRRRPPHPPWIEDVFIALTHAEE